MNLGFLVGVYGESSGSFGFGDGRYCNEFGGCFSGYGNYTLLLNGDQYDLSGVIYFEEYNIFGELVRQDSDSLDYGSEPIYFDQIQPVQSVPEPLTLLGVATALSFGTVFKSKKLAKKASK